MKTKEIWLIVRDGYNDQIVLVKDYDSKYIHHAFLSKEDAQNYIDANEILGRPKKVELFK